MTAEGYEVCPNCRKEVLRAYLRGGRHAKTAKCIADSAAYQASSAGFELVWDSNSFQFGVLTEANKLVTGCGFSPIVDSNSLVLHIGSRVGRSRVSGVQQQFWVKKWAMRLLTEDGSASALYYGMTKAEDRYGRLLASAHVDPAKRAELEAVVRLGGAKALRHLVESGAERAAAKRKEIEKLRAEIAQLEQEAAEEEDGDR